MTSNLCLYAGSIERPEVSEEEAQQIEAAYALPDRTWAAISQNQRVNAMGKFNMGADKNKLKELARKKKEKAEKEKEKAAASDLKRKNSDLSRGRSPDSAKKQKKPIEGDRVDQEGGRSALSVVTAAPKNKGKTTVRETELVTRSNFAPDSVKIFVDDVTQVLGRSPSENSTPPQSDSEQFVLPSKIPRRYI